jgi:hypothetical protein
MTAAETARRAAPPIAPRDHDAFMAAYRAECAAHGVAPARLAGHFQAVYLACNVAAWRDLRRGPFAKGRGR